MGWVNLGAVDSAGDCKLLFTCSSLRLRQPAKSVLQRIHLRFQALLGGHMAAVPALGELAAAADE